MARRCIPGMSRTLAKVCGPWRLDNGAVTSRDRVSELVYGAVADPEAEAIRGATVEELAELEVRPDEDFLDIPAVQTELCHIGA